MPGVKRSYSAAAEADETVRQHFQRRGKQSATARSRWIPAFAGMTSKRFEEQELDSSLRWNDEQEIRGARTGFQLSLE